MTRHPEEGAFNSGPSFRKSGSASRAKVALADERGGATKERKSGAAPIPRISVSLRGGRLRGEPRGSVSGAEKVI